MDVSSASQTLEFEQKNKKINENRAGVSSTPRLTQPTDRVLRGQRRAGHMTQERAFPSDLEQVTLGLDTGSESKGEHVREPVQ